MQTESLFSKNSSANKVRYMNNSNKSVTLQFYEQKIRL
jgi:hypothetical protein